MAPTVALRFLQKDPAPSPTPEPSSQTSDPLLSLSLSFRSVAHGAEKIVFITCQHLAALSYAMQDSIKLSYTGMKLQNRPGTPQQNYQIFFPLPKIQRSMFAYVFFFFDRQRDVGFDMMEKKYCKRTFWGNCPSQLWCDEKKQNNLFKQLWPLLKVKLCKGPRSTLHSRFTFYSHYWLCIFYSTLFVTRLSKWDLKIHEPPTAWPAAKMKEITMFIFTQVKIVLLFLLAL